MEVILPLRIKNEKAFLDSAFKLGYDEFEAHKFLFIIQQSDLDIFPNMGDERLCVLLYAWELCEDYKKNLDPNEFELPQELEIFLKVLVPWSLDIWFSKEWCKCEIHLTHALIYCLKRGRELLLHIPDMMQINWDFLLEFNQKPWDVPYLKTLKVTKEMTLEMGAQNLECEEEQASEEDLAYMKREQFPLIVLRLVKLFDQNSMDMVKTLCMRVIVAWNKHYQIERTSGPRMPYIPPEDKKCLLIICHMYLMAVYEVDDVRGYVIDNLINNLRFYYQGFQEHSSSSFLNMDHILMTPARLIALTCVHLRLQKREFFDYFIWNSFDTSVVNLFGVISQAYKSYLLGNLLMELHNMNEDDFSSNMALYKRLMNAYINEREKSELFILNETKKAYTQSIACNQLQIKTHISDFKSKICKGNRMGNIGNYQSSDDKEEAKKEEDKPMDEQTKDEADMKNDDDKKSDLRLDPIFQNIPNNESILYYVYENLAKRHYKGWHFAKIVLLVKIIGHELNMIETWRYHPGLTADFMLNLENKLSSHYVDLAKIFADHPFLEQEFWLTAFYLNPTLDVYESVKRFGMRNNRKRNDDSGKVGFSTSSSISANQSNETKFGLLSSTIDVKGIIDLANTSEPTSDYHPLFRALQNLRLPDSVIKDMLTVIFVPRNRYFAWVVDWNVLRQRCKSILNNKNEKKRFVELNMAEANDRLKFLKIDYNKYKNRPQLDYGSIEEGYENLMTAADFNNDDDPHGMIESEEEEEEEDDFEDDEDVYETKKGRRPKKDLVEEADENSQNSEEDLYLRGKRRTRARTAAALASYLFTTERTRKRRKNDEETSDNSQDNKDEKSNDSKIENSSLSQGPSPTNVEEKESALIEVLPKQKLKDCLKVRPEIQNPTHGLKPTVDLWNVEQNLLQSIETETVSLLESSNVLHRFSKLKTLSRQINPFVTNDHDRILDDSDLVVTSEIDIKMEVDKQLTSLAVEMHVDMEDEQLTTIEMDVVKKEERISPVNIDFLGEAQQQMDQVQMAKVMEDELMAADQTDLEVEEELLAADQLDLDVEEELLAADQLDLDVEEELLAANQLDLVMKKEQMIPVQLDLINELEQSVPVQLNLFKEGKPLAPVQLDLVKEEEQVMHSEPTDMINEQEKNISPELNVKVEVDMQVPADELNVAVEDESQINPAQMELTKEEMLMTQTLMNEVNEEEKEEDEEREEEQNEDRGHEEEMLEEEMPEEEETEEGGHKKEMEVKETLEEEEMEKQEKEDENKEEKEEEIQGAPDQTDLMEAEEMLPNSNIEQLISQTQISVVKDEEEEEKLEEIDEAKKQKQEEDIQVTSVEMSVLDNEATQSTSIQIDVVKEEEQVTSVEINAVDKDELVIIDDDIDNIEKEKEQVIAAAVDAHKLSDVNESQIPSHDEKAVSSKKISNDDNSSDSGKSDISTTARRDSGEASESNCENNSKSNSDHNDGDIDDKSRVTATVDITTKDTIAEQLETDKSQTIEKPKPIEQLKAEPIGEITETTGANEAIVDESSTITDPEQNETKNSDEPQSDNNTVVKDEPGDMEDAEMRLIWEDSKDQTDVSAVFNECILNITKQEDNVMRNEHSPDEMETVKNELKQFCLKTKLKVILSRLTANDLQNLRQPIVKLKRVNLEAVNAELKKKRARTENLSYDIDTDESSNHSCLTVSSLSNAAPSANFRRKLLQRRQALRSRRNTSDSDCAVTCDSSTNSEKKKLRPARKKSNVRKIGPASSLASSSKAVTKRRLSSPLSSSSSSARSTRQHKKLTVTPRSASGLKLRISQRKENSDNETLSSLRRKQKPAPVVVDEVIQLSSGSSVDSPEALEIIDELDDDDPLFEKEIVLKKPF